MRYVLDASALLALLFREPGADRVNENLNTSYIGSVNLAEVATVIARRSGDTIRYRAAIEALAIPILQFDTALAFDAGALWPVTRKAGSSLEDRCALALARRLDAVLVTSDAQLLAIAPAVGVAGMAIRQRGGGE